MADVFLSPGVRTPFVKAGGVYAQQSSLQLSIPVVQKMRERAQPDLLVWGQVIPDPSLSNIARELRQATGRVGTQDSRECRPGPGGFEKVTPRYAVRGAVIVHG